MELFGQPKGVTSWMFDHQGIPRVAITQQEGQLGLYWHGPKQVGWTQLAQAPIAKGLPFEPVAIHADGQLYVTQEVGEKGEAALTRFDFSTMAPQPKMMVRAPGFDFRGGLIFDESGRRALGVHVETDGEQTIWFDAAMKQLQTLVDERLPGQVNRISCRRCGAPDMMVLVRSHSDRNPGQLWLYQADGQRWHLLSHILEGIDPQQMAAVELHRIQARDGRDLPVWLTLPQGVMPGKPAPAVVLVHGGPWVRDGHWRWSALQQFLASRGYLVISPEFRGSNGYGSAHFLAGMKQWGQAMQDDVADALLWARAQCLANERACIAGASYGGYASFMGLVRHPELYRCGVAWVAVADLMLFVKGSWWTVDDISDSGRRFVLSEWVGDPEKDASMLKANSPLALARQIKAPVLLGIGEDDLRVPLAHGKRMRDALTEAGHPPQWVSYPGEGHSWRLPTTRVDFARRMETFLKHNLETDR
jgi:dipeptidyl aminopeptidase/acylaminoacyl peptidase